MKTRTAALSWALAGVLFALTAVVPLRAQTAPVFSVPLAMSGGMARAQVRTGEGAQVAVQRAVAPDPDAGREASAGRCQDAPAAGRSTLSTLWTASCFLYQKVLPFVVTHFVGRA